MHPFKTAPKPHVKEIGEICIPDLREVGRISGYERWLPKPGPGDASVRLECCRCAARETAQAQNGGIKLTDPIAGGSAEGVRLRKIPDHWQRVTPEGGLSLS